MDIPVWEEGMTAEESEKVGYWERNMLALLLCRYQNILAGAVGSNHSSGWYTDTDNNWDGWRRVISIDNGQFNFHIPDNFDVGDLPEIKPTWDGHSTHDKWKKVMKICGIREEN